MESEKFQLNKIEGIPTQYKKSIEYLLPFEKNNFYNYEDVNKNILKFFNNPKVKEIIKNIFNDFKNKLISIFYNKYISFIFISKNFKIIYIPSFKKSEINEFDLFFNNDENFDISPTNINYEIHKIVKKT